MREKAALELAKSKQEILEKYTRDRTIRALKLDVERKRTGRNGQTGTVGSSRNTRRRSSRGKSPRARSRRPGTAWWSTPIPHAGAMPAEFRIKSRKARKSANGRRSSAVVDLNGPKQVTRKVREVANPQDSARHEGQDSRRRLPQPVVRRHGRRGLLPCRTSRASIQDGSKLYTTKVRIDNGVPGLRPGMTAQVEFLIAGRENVLSVPVQAVLHYDGKNACRGPEARRRDRAARSSVGVIQRQARRDHHGIESGDTVILNPAAFITGKDENQKLAAPPQRPRNE